MITTLLLQLALAVGAMPELKLEPGSQLSFKGSIEAKAEETGDKAKKTFDLTLFIARLDAAGADVYWIVDERSRGSLPWIDHVGRQKADAQWQFGGAGPRLAYDRADGRGVAPLSIPLFSSEKPLAAAAEWKQDQLEFHVDKPAKLADREVWPVSVRDGFGLKRTLWVDSNSPVVVAMHERLVMGRGEQFELKLELVGAQAAAAEQRAAVIQAFDQLIELRGKLNPASEIHEIHWTDRQLAILEQQLPGLEKLTAGTILEKLAQSARRDLLVQAGRSQAVADLGDKQVGEKVADFSIRGSAGEALSQKDLVGKVTVLHFWDYRDEPLQEPYGQVGYLDFLYHRHQPAGLQLYGIAVDGRLKDEKTRSAAERSVKKVRSFMNLSYPVMLDSGSLIKQFGDPRLLGANLPLFVVVGPDGKVLHYHAGFYEVARDQGLKELDGIIAAALAKNKTGK